METKLAWVRRMSGMSQSQLAREAGVSVRVIQQAEQGCRSVNGWRAETLYKVSTALGCPMETLVEHDYSNIL